MLYVLAAVGALTVALALVIAILLLVNWLQQPVVYTVAAAEVSRYVASWGRVVAGGGRILVRQPATDVWVAFAAGQPAGGSERILLRIRNAQGARQRFDDVRAALEGSGIAFVTEHTRAGRPRSLVTAFALDDPHTPEAAAHAARVSLMALGAPDGPFEVTCVGTPRPSLVAGAADAIPWTRGARLRSRFFPQAARASGDPPYPDR